MRYSLSAAVLFLSGVTSSCISIAKDSVWARLDDCPHYWSEVKKKDKAISKGLFGLFQERALAKDRLDVPEYHDCQRLIVKSTQEVLLVDTTNMSAEDRQKIRVKASGADPAEDEYGPLAVVFAASTLEKAGDDPEVNAPGSNQGNSNNANQGNSNNPNQGNANGGSSKGDNDKFFAAAQIVNVSKIGYPPLRMDPGLSYYCIYLSSRSGEWEAQMTKEKSCSSKITRNDLAAKNGQEMKVTEIKPSDSPNDYPAVVRFHWDGAGQAIGAKCKGAWCVMSFNPDPKLEQIYPGPAHESVPGWYDEQRLGTIDPLTGKLKVSTTMGRVIPDKDLDNTPVSSFWHDWVPAAYVHVDSDDYKEKLNFTKTDGQTNPNKISLRLVPADPAVKYPHDCTAEETNPTPRTGSPDPKGTWVAKIESAAGCKVFKTQREPHVTGTAHHHGHKVNVVGAARWRFIRNDETVWVECGNGCCQVIG